MSPVSPIDRILQFIHNKHITHLVVHGLKTRQHTHRYIHESIYNTFNYIAERAEHHINVIWCEDEYGSKNIYTPTLYNPEHNFLIFATPHLELDKYLPILDNAYYIVHFRDCVVYTDTRITKYDELLKQKKAVKYVEFRYSADNIEYSKSDINRIIQISNTPFWMDTTKNEVHLAWATNLFPEKIDENIGKIAASTEPYIRRQSYFCGHVWRANNDELTQWKTLCDEHDVECIIEREKNELLHQEKVGASMLAPAIQGASQRQSENKYYMPCRIFKNVSYGAIPITNNIGVYNMFKEYGIIYDSDLNQLMEKCMDFCENMNDNYEDYKQQQISAMEYVRDNHTYINRINTLIQYGLE